MTFKSQNKHRHSVYQWEKTEKLHQRYRGKQPTKQQQPNGTIYRMQCDCLHHYYETAGPINIRINEHKTSARKQDGKSAVQHTTYIVQLYPTSFYINIPCRQLLQTM